MKSNKNKIAKLNLIIISSYVSLMLVWLVFGRPITKFVAPKFPARNLYCCMFNHHRNYGAVELYDHEYGLGVSYTKGVENLNENKTKTIQELNNMGYYESVQTGGMYLILSFIFIPIILFYNLAIIFSKKIMPKTWAVIKNICIVIVLFWTLFVLGVAGHSMWYGIW